MADIEQAARNIRKRDGLAYLRAHPFYVMRELPLLVIGLVLFGVTLGLMLGVVIRIMVTSQ